MQLFIRLLELLKALHPDNCCLVALRKHVRDTEDEFSRSVAPDGTYRRV